MTGLVQCLVFLIILTLVVGIAGLAILLKFVVAVEEAVKVAPSFLDDYIENNVAGFIDEHIRSNIPEIVQNAILTLMMGEMANATALPDAPATVALDAPHRAAWSGCGGVHSEPLCASFKRSCAAFAVCEQARTREACGGFVDSITESCSLNRCDVYEDRTLCNRVVYLCNNRVRATWDAQARAFMEAELQELCTVLAP
jgi:hypothetical protein